MKKTHNSLIKEIVEEFKKVKESNSNL